MHFAHFSHAFIFGISGKKSPRIGTKVGNLYAYFLRKCPEIWPVTEELVFGKMWCAPPDISFHEPSISANAERVFEVFLAQGICAG